MAEGGPKKPEAPPFGADDLDDEIERWTEAFDRAHEEAPPPPAEEPRAPTPVPPAAPGVEPLAAEAYEGSVDPDFAPAGEAPADLVPPDQFLDGAGELEFLGEVVALGEMLGAPPPLAPPPPADEEEEVLSSAPRPARTSSRPSLPRIATPIAPASSELPPAPTDDEIFGEAAQRDFGAAIAGDEFQEDVPTRGAQQVDVGDAPGEFAESTRIAAIDEALLAKASRPPPAAPAPPVRRTPAIVRREELKRVREEAREAEDHDDFDHAESTRIADASLIEQIAHASEEPSEELRFDAPAAPAPPPAQVEPRVELDESFYDDIEIASADEAGRTRPMPAPAMSAAPVARRVTQNVVRRATPPPVRAPSPSVAPPAAPPPPAAPAAPAAPEAEAPEPPDLAVIDMEADEPETGIHVAAAAVAAEPLEPALAAAALGGERDVATSAEPVDLSAEPVDLSAEPVEPAPAVAEEVLEPDAPPAASLADEVADFSVDLRSTDALEGPAEASEFAPVPADDFADAPAAAPYDEPAAAEASMPPDVESDVAIDEPSSAPAVVLAPPPVPALALDPGAFRFPESTEVAYEADDGAALLALFERELALTSDPARAARLRVAAGRAAELAGDTGRAREHFEEALAADPRHAPAARALRRLLVRLGAFRDAVAALDTELALASEAERRALAAYRADLLVAIGEQDLARLAFGELLDARPDDVRSLMAQVELAWSDERDDELVETLERVSAHVGDAELKAALLALRGRLLERAGHDEAAAESYRQAYAVSPRDRTLCLALSRLAARAGRPADAALWDGRFIEGIHDAPLVAASARRRAAAHARGDHLPGALAALDEALTVAPGDPLVLEALADTHEQAGRPREAVRVLQAWADVEVDGWRKAEVLRRAASICAGPLEDPAAAAAALRGAAEADPGDAAAAVELEAAYLAAGDLDAAVELNRTAAQSDPEGAIFERVRAGRLLEGAGRIDEAIAELEAARAVAPESAAIAETLARLYLLGGRLADRARLFGELAETDAARGDVTAARIRAARAAEAAATALLGDESADDQARTAANLAAEAAWRKVLDADTDSYVAHAAIVRLAEQRGDVAALAEALAAFQRALRDPAAAAAVAVRRVELLLADGASASAIEGPLEQVLSLDPTEPRAWALLVAALVGSGRWDDAVRRWIERADALPAGGERDALRYRAAAAIDERGEDPARVVDLLAPLNAARPAFTGAEVLLLRAWRRIGDAAALAGQLERALGRAPREGDADGEPAAPPPPAPTPQEEPAGLRFGRLLQLGELVSRRVGDAARAVGILGDALALRPDDPVARDAFARACADAGEFGPLADRALADLKRAEDAGSLSDKVAAYEELARIDADLRGDAASSVLAWETVVELEPAHARALRALERTYVAEARDADLAAVYGRLLGVVETAADAAGLAMARARLSELLGRALDAIEDYRRAVTADPAQRMALFRLEARARDTDAIEELAQLDDAIAAFFAGEPRGQAAFLTRAAECLAELGRVDEAVARFRGAADVLAGHQAALRAWRRLALANERWHEVVESAEREAGAARTDAERARLYHLAGVAAMDRALDGERAVENLRRVLALDPRHDDALRRLRLLYDEQGRWEDLAQLLAARVEIETRRDRLVEHHHALAKIYRDFLGDRDRAKAHLRAVLAQSPQDLLAVAALGDIAWEQGQWAEAADALIARAKLEKNPKLLKEIFYRLGLIYAERLPDARWAVKSFERVLQLDPNDDGALDHLARLTMQTGDWRVALGACERLVQTTEDPAARIGHLHRIAQIYTEGFKDVKRAEDALRRALDTDPTDPRALAALVEHYKKQRDHTSLRVHMDRVLGAMRQRLARDAFDGAAYRVMSRALGARAQAGVVGSVEAARCAAEISHALGAAEEQDRILAAETLRIVPKAAGLGDLGVDETLFHPSIPNGFRQVFRLLHETLAKRYMADLRRHGVGKADKLPRSGHPAREIAAAVARDLGVAEFEMYVSSAQPTVLAVELTDPLSIVVGAQLASPDKPPQLRFAIGRALKLATSYMAVPARLTPDELGALLAGIIRQFDPSFTPAGLTLGAVAEEQQKLGRLISKRLRDELVPFATEISGLDFDHQALWRGVQHTGNRAGLVVSGSALAGLVVLLRMQNHRDIPSARGDELIEEYFRFAVSDEHCEIRRVLGQT